MSLTDTTQWRQLAVNTLVRLMGRHLAWRLGRSLYMLARRDVPNAIRSNGELMLQREVVRNVTRPVVFDVGANVGQWSRELLSI